MDLNALNYVPRPCLAQNEFNIGKKECCGLESIYLFYVCDVYEITRFFFFFWISGLTNNVANDAVCLLSVPPHFEIW